MTSSVVVRRYALAYFSLARERGESAAWRIELARASDALGDPGVRLALANPRLPRADRVRLALELIDGVSQEACNLVRLLVERGRTSLLGDVLVEYDRLADSESGIVRAEVTTAIPVDDALRRRITESLRKSLGREVVATVNQDPSIIGGLVIHIGDRVIDNSIRTHLRQLKAALL